MPSPRLIVVGDGPVADPLLHVIDVLEYPAIVRTSEELPADLGPRDHVVLVVEDRNRLRDLCKEAILARCSYIGLVGAAEPLGRLVIQLVQMGIAHEMFDRVAAPAGLDLGAGCAGEIAIAVAAELVQARRGRFLARVITDVRN